MRTLGGRYRLDQQIGEGGMAQVWRAYDDVLDREVAVKLSTADHGTDPYAYQRARNEARCAARLAHPNIAAVYDFGTSQRSGRGAAYLVMELVEGPLLSDYLRRGPLDWRFAVRVCAEVSAGLAAAHSRSIVHRDIKPANVVLTPSGAKILDFGIAATHGQPDRLADGTVFGTPAYMAPERLDGHPVAPPLDMYALGVLLYQSLTARLPWQATTEEQLLKSHRATPPEPLPPIDGSAPELAEVYDSCLSKVAERRPTAVAAALILAASVDVEVYVPSVLQAPLRSVVSPRSEADLRADTAAYTDVGWVA